MPNSDNLPTPENLYFKLFEIAEKTGNFSDTEKNSIAIGYAKKFAELWRDVEAHYDDIEELGKALVNANAVLAGDDKIKPEFKAIQFDGKGIGRILPGNFANCTLENCVFINCDIGLWHDEEFENAVINNCVFDDACYCSASNFAKVKHIDNCTFKESFAEFDAPIDHNDTQYIPAAQANEVLITTILEYAKKITVLEEENQALRAQALRAQLQSLQAAQANTSTASGFFEAKRKNPEDSAEPTHAKRKTCKGFSDRKLSAC